MRRFFRSPDGDGGTQDPSKGGGGDELATVKAELAKLVAANAKREADERAAKAAADEAEAKRRGDFEKVLAEKDAKLARLAELEKREEARVAKVTERNDARIKTLPKDRQALVPAALRADPDALAEWLDASWSLLSGAPAGEGSGRPAASPGSTEITDDKVPADIAAEARSRGLTPAAWFKILLKAGRVKAPGVTQ